MRRAIGSLMVVGLGACQAPPPRVAEVDPGSRPFLSSQAKPPAPARPDLEPVAGSAQRLMAQAAFFQGRGALDPRAKAAALGPIGPAIDVGQRDLRAGPISLLPLTLAAGQRVTVQTRDLSEGGDTVVHLFWREGDREVAFDDDGGQEAGASMFSHVAERAGAYVILIRAYATGDEGRCDLLVDGELKLRGAPFGGSSVPVAPGRTLQVVLLNDGQAQDPWPPTRHAATDTLLLVVDGETGALAQLDDDSGVELGSALQAGAGQVAIIGAPHPASAGSARLVVNDVASGDMDGDGLGDRLEQELCLCSGGLVEACGFNCTGEVNPQDTDGDGVSDGEEVLGAERPGFPQLLPRWGANPRHKDLWVEIDLAQWTDETIESAGAALRSDPQHRGGSQRGAALRAPHTDEQP